MFTHGIRTCFGSTPVFSVAVRWVSYANEGFRGFSPSGGITRRDRPLKMSDAYEQNSELRPSKEAQVRAGITETRYPSRDRADFIHHVGAHIFTVGEIHGEGLSKTLPVLLSFSTEKWRLKGLPYPTAARYNVP